MRVTESDVEQAALDWLATHGWAIGHGPEIAPDTPGAERADYGEVVLHGRLRSALARLNPDVPDDALDDARRRLTRPAGATLEARNRDLQRMLVAGVTVEHVDADGRVRGAQIRVLDFDNPHGNDWLVVNQFTVVENRHERRPDIVLFVNGLPLAVIELKNPAGENATDPHGLPAISDLQGGGPVAVRVQCRARGVGRTRRPHRHADGRAGVDSSRGARLRRDAGRPAPAAASVLLEGVCAHDRFLRWCATSSCSRTTAVARWSRRWRAFTSSTPSGRPVSETRRAAALQEAGGRLRESRGRYESGRQPGAPAATGGSG